MIIKLTFKTPDALDDAVNNAICKSGPEYDEQDEEDEEYQREALKKKLSNWIEYGEYVYLEYDTEKKTMTVQEI